MKTQNIPQNQMEPKPETTNVNIPSNTMPESIQTTIPTPSKGLNTHNSSIGACFSMEY
jgi:hypothetical protein